MLVIVRKRNESICLYDNGRYNINIKLKDYDDDGGLLILQYDYYDCTLNFNLNYNKNFYLNKTDIDENGPYFFCRKNFRNYLGVVFFFNVPNHIHIWREEIYKLKMQGN